MTWHELSSPAAVRTNVAKYRQWEKEVGIGPLPINVNEYGHNYHLSVPGQVVQWVSAIEESKIDADLAYWNIDGNLNDSAVEANKGNGQWWLFNAYGQMSGHTVQVTAPHPNQQYTLQGVATLDKDKKQSRAIFGGKSGDADVVFENIDPKLFGDDGARHRAGDPVDRPGRRLGPAAAAGGPGGHGRRRTARSRSR